MIDCAYCQDLLPPDRLSEGHLAVRWGDAPAIVMLDGEDVSNRCVEARAGTPGWAVIYPEPVRVCEANREHVYARFVEGNVDVIKTEFARWQMGRPTFST